MVCYNVIFNFKSLVYRQTDDDVILFTSKMTSTSSRLHSFMLSLLKSKTSTNIDQSQKSNGDENKQNKIISQKSNGDENKQNKIIQHYLM